jgi:hypothetical protein
MAAACSVEDGFQGLESLRLFLYRNIKDHPFISPARFEGCHCRDAVQGKLRFRALRQVQREQVQKDNMMILQVDRGLHYTAAVERAPTLQRLFLLPSSRCGALFDISVNIGVPVGRREERYGAFTDISAQIVLPMEQREERYSLIVSEKGSAVLRACNGLGFLRGLQTFEQLVYTLPDSDLRPSGIKYIPNAPISIRDQPAFPYRGQLLDTSRNFFPVDVILKMLQTMSYAKMSAFHWCVCLLTNFTLTRIWRQAHH